MEQQCLPSKVDGRLPASGMRKLHSAWQIFAQVAEHFLHLFPHITLALHSLLITVPS
jgi:hypothetical protein